MSGSGEEAAPEKKKQKTASDGSAGFPERVVVNVGGTTFATTKSTLASHSTYFGSLFSEEWADRADGDNDTFLDQDPEAFRVLLSYMRLGKVMAADLTPAVLIQANFLGMERLLQSVRVVARREAFAGRTKKLYHAARTAGVLDGSEVIKKEYAFLRTYYHCACHFEEQIHHGPAAEVVASVYCGVKDNEGHSVMTYSTFIDCLHWLHRNGYVLVEEELSKEDNGEELAFSYPSVSYFSRLSEAGNSDNLASSIMYQTESDLRILERREFVSFVEIDSQLDGLTLLFTEAAYGEVESRPLAGDVLMGQVLADVCTKRKESSDKLTLMHWLQQEGYTRREPYLESIYLPALRDATDADRDGTRKRICLSVWSRRMRKEDDNAAG